LRSPPRASSEPAAIPVDQPNPTIVINKDVPDIEVGVDRPYPMKAGHSGAYPFPKPYRVLAGMDTIGEGSSCRNGASQQITTVR
jgi:hypothetical protein